MPAAVSRWRSDMFVGDLQATLDELGQDYRLRHRGDDAVADPAVGGSRDPAGTGAAHLIELCPRCKRVVRGQAYFAANGKGF